MNAVVSRASSRQNIGPPSRFSLTILRSKCAPPRPDLDDRGLSEEAPGDGGRHRMKPAMHDVNDVVSMPLGVEPPGELDRPDEERDEMAAAEIRRPAHAQPLDRRPPMDFARRRWPRAAEARRS